MEVTVVGDGSSPAQVVLNVPCKRANAATDDILGTKDGKGWHLLEHKIFKIQNVSEI